MPGGIAYEIRNTPAFGVDNKKGERMTLISTEDILTAEHEAIKKVIDYSDNDTPEDYGLERIRGIHIMVETLLRMKKEGR